MNKKEKNFSGVVVPMVTPITANGEVDCSALEKLMNSFIDAGISVFLLGTTGESASVPLRHRSFLVKTAMEYVKNKIKIFAGISGNCLEESIEQANLYAAMGVDTVVAHPPYYFPLSPDMMLKYFEKLADHIKCPLFLYNNPMTTHSSISLDVADKLSYHPNIAGLKDSERDIQRLNKAISLWRDREDFVHLTGWAAQSTHALASGSDGIVPSTANYAPKIYRNLYNMAAEGNMSAAIDLQMKADQLSELYMAGRNLSLSLPALKTIMSELGLCQPFVYPPLETTPENEALLIKEKTRLMFQNLNL
jgi:4-hydroxy-tetrahydrodipicolinate synthase